MSAIRNDNSSEKAPFGYDNSKSCWPGGGGALGKLSIFRL